MTGTSSPNIENVRLQSIPPVFCLSQPLILTYLLPANLFFFFFVFSETKNQWSRDDPAFVAVLTAFLTISSIAYGIGFRVGSVSAFVRLITASLLTFLGGGAAVATACWFIANKYMHRYGVTREDLGRVAISQRNHALRNPRAWGYGKELTMEQYLASEPIAHPLCLFDFCQETDGGCAILLTSAERARDLRHKPAIIRGVTQASTRGQEQMTSYYRDELESLPEMEMAAERVYAQAGLGPKDIDAACLYDAFTSEVIMQLESFGFCGRGEGIAAQAVVLLERKPETP